MKRTICDSLAWLLCEYFFRVGRASDRMPDWVFVATGAPLAYRAGCWLYGRT